jgi:hypothetical protein
LFWERVRDVCGLSLSPPEQALVLSVDEKDLGPGQAAQAPDQTPVRGRRRRREFEYVRHGTASLFAALDVHSGEVLAEPISRDDLIAKFLRFIADYEHKARPFNWTYAADPLVASLTRVVTRAATPVPEWDVRASEAL